MKIRRFKNMLYSQDIELEGILNEFFEISTLKIYFSLIKVEEIVKTVFL
jgi:hypothetical protein